jgi:hypothetical protein
LISTKQIKYGNKKCFQEQLKKLKSQLHDSDFFLSTIDGKNVSAVDLGGMEDLIDSATSFDSKQYTQEFIYRALKAADKSGTKSALIVRGSPYRLEAFENLSTSVLLIFDAHLYESGNQPPINAALSASINVITGKHSSDS